MSVATTKDALTAMLAALFAADPGILVSHGVPDPSPQPDVVAVLDGTSTGDVDEERFDLTLIVSCYVGGGAVAGPVALLRAHTILDQIHGGIYANPTLTGGCRVAALDPDYRSVETVAYDAGGTSPVGRLAEITAAVHVWTGRGVLGSLARPHDAP